MAERWLPILNVFDENGVDACYEIHPGEDLHDGVTFERFLEATNNHNRVNILYDPSHFVLQQQLPPILTITMNSLRLSCKRFRIKPMEKRCVWRLW